MTTKIDGGAGTGKTTKCMKLLAEVTEDIPITGICMTTLTRIGRDVFKERATKLLKIKPENEKESLKWFGTMHQICFRLINDKAMRFLPEISHKGNKLQASRIATLDDYNDVHTYMEKVKDVDKVRLAFMEYAGIKREYVRRFKDEWEYVEKIKFNKILEISSILRSYTTDGIIDVNLYRRYLKETNSRLSYRRDYDSRYVKIDEKEVIAFTLKIQEFLRSNNYYDYTRILEVTLKYLQLDLMDVPFVYAFFDEFQDFTPIQIEIYKEITKHCIDNVIAGDPNQSIYGWIGANPRFFNELGCEERIILPKTYRYGRNGLRNSLTYLEHFPDYEDKHVEPADHDDIVIEDHPSNWFKYVDKNIETVILHRMNKSVNWTCNQLEGLGIPYIRLGQKSKWDKLFRLYNILSSLHRGDIVKTDDVKSLIGSMSVKSDTKMYQSTISGGIKEIPGKVTVLKRGVKSQIKDLPDGKWNKTTFSKQFLDKQVWDINLIKSSLKYLIGKEKVGVIDEIAKTGIIFPDPGSIDDVKMWVGNIHKIKGGERYRVILFRNIDYPITEFLTPLHHNNPTFQEECRVFYVGSTRHTHELISLGTNAFDKTFPNTSVDINYLIRQMK